MSDNNRNGRSSYRFGTQEDYSSARRGYDAPRRTAAPGQRSAGQGSRPAAPRSGSYTRDYVRPQRSADRYGAPQYRGNSRYSTTGQQQYRSNARYDAPRQPQRSAQQNRSRKPRRKGNNVFVKILKVILLVFFAIFAGIGKVFSGLNRRLDVFRKGEASAVIVNTLLSGVLVVVLLCVFMLCKPGIDASRARSQAAKGNADVALKLVNSLEKNEYDSEKLQKVRISVAEGLTAAGEYDAVVSLLSKMPGGMEKEELGKRNSYAEANALYNSGDYTEAAQIFYQMNDYQDSALRYADCRCALAIEAWQKGDEASARSLLLDVPDVAQRVSAAALKVSGSQAGAQAILSAELFQADNLSRMEQTMQEINAARSDMPEGRIAAGKYHTLGLRSDGVVLGAGDNSQGQLDVGAWNGIVQVAAGAMHSVGLRSDGTVLAVGDDSQGQCEVSGWTDIVSVACSAYATIGLKSDGSVVACGRNSELVSGWHGATFVAGGSYSLACLYDKGAMLSSHKGAQMDMGVVLYDMSVCGPVSVGILYDGTMVSTNESAPKWTGMVTATASETCILGIDSNGQVQSHFYRPGDAVQISVPGEAVEVESGGMHHVVLASDGRVYAFGNNDYGQCSLENWQL